MHLLGKAGKDRTYSPSQDGLSFLRKQESRVLDGPSFRIKFGMTALKVRLTEYGLYKQTQSAGHPNGCNLKFKKGLWK